MRVGQPDAAPGRAPEAARRAVPATAPASRAIANVRWSIDLMGRRPRRPADEGGTTCAS
jgi:hypothetical protein